MFNRIKRIWELSKYEDKDLDLTTRILESEGTKPKGAADGAFLEDMTDEEFALWEREQDTVWRRFMNQVRNLK